jgi:ABC-type lipoprotein release transport system permease subunit
MLKLFLWLRYLRRKRIVFLSIAAVALSVGLLIVVASLFSGFIDAFERSAVEAIGDIALVTPTKFSNYPLFIEQLKQLSIAEAATPALLSQGLLHLGKGNVRAVSVWGIEPDSWSKVTNFKQSLLRQKNFPNSPSWEVPELPGELGGYVGIGAVAEPDEKTDQYDSNAIVKQMVGQQVSLTTGTIVRSGDANTPGGQDSFKRRVISFRIADIVFTGVYDLDRRFIYIPIDRLQKALYPDEKGNLAGHIQIKLRPGVNPEVALAEIRGLWQVFAQEQLKWDQYLIRQTEIATAQQFQSRYVAELKKQMGVLLLIFGVVSFSVVLLIFCIFYMIVRLKQKDIAIVKSCGAASTSVAWIFLGFGLCVGVFGSLLGAVLGYLITRNINVIENWVRILFGLKLWKSSVYMFSKMPNQVDWASALPIVFLAVAAAALGTVIPAIVAARTKPVDILRYE